MSELAYRTSDRRVVPWLLLGLLLLGGALYAAAYLYSSDRIAHGTTVAGVDIGGQLPPQARRTLAAGLARRAAEPISVSAEGERSTIRPDLAGISVDVPASVSRAPAGRSWDPRRIWDYFDGGRDLPAVVSVDRAALRRAVRGFSVVVSNAPVQGAVRFSDGEATPRYPRSGTVVDAHGAVAALRGAFLHTTGPDDVVALPTRAVTPSVTVDAVSRAMDDFANPAVSGVVKVRLGSRRLLLQPRVFSRALSMKVDGHRLRPVLDGRVLLRSLRPTMIARSRAPRDARVTLLGGRPHVTRARPGRTFRRSDVIRPFLRVVTRQGRARTLVVRARPVRPAVTTREIRRLGITEQVSSFTTRFPYAVDGSVDLDRAAQLLDGAVLEPGQTFSLNRTVGGTLSDRTAAAQVATTTFNAAFLAGLDDVEHRSPSTHVDHYPVGREATVRQPGVDLRFEDTTPYGVYIAASVDQATPGRRGALHVTMYSTDYWDITTTRSPRYDRTRHGTRHLTGGLCVPSRGYDGFEVDVQRIFHRHGSSTVDHRETVHTVYRPTDAVTC